MPRLEFKNQLVFSQLTRLPSGNSSQPVIFKKARVENVPNSFLKPSAVARPVELRPTSGSRSPCRVSTSSGSFRSCERIFNNKRFIHSRSSFSPNGDHVDCLLVLLVGLLHVLDPSLVEKFLAILKQLGASFNEVCNNARVPPRQLKGNN